jgi:hypothetical protein
MPEHPAIYPPPSPLPPVVGGRRTLLAALIGVVVGAAAVGVAWLAIGTRGDGGLGGGATLDLPDQLGSYRRVADVELFRKDSARKSLERMERWNGKSAERLSESHGGAAAAAETYSDDTAENLITIYAVRAGDPGKPFVPFEDPADLKVAKPTNELLTFGEVNCVVYNEPTPAGSEPREGSARVQYCVRSDESLTVRTAPLGGDLGARPNEVANLVNEAWEAVN